MFLRSYELNEWVSMLTVERTEELRSTADVIVPSLQSTQVVVVMGFNSDGY